MAIPYFVKLVPYAPLHPSQGRYTASVERSTGGGELICHENAMRTDGW